MKKKMDHRFNLVLLIVTLVLSPLVILAALNLAGLLLPEVRELQPLQIGLIFLIMGLLTGLAVLVTGILCKSYVGDLVTGEKKIFRTLLIFLLCLVVLFGVAAGLEYLYEKALWASNNETHQETYVFLVDDSGSTRRNDPYNERYQAINEILSNAGDGQYMVYSFSAKTKIIQPATQISDTLPNLTPEIGGRTYMKAALEKVIEDYHNGIWSSMGEAKVILLTDGEADDLFAGDFGALTVLDDCVQERIQVNIVGLGSSVDGEMLQYIADTTGGKFVSIADSSQIAGAMQQAASTETGDYNLLTPRPARHNTPLMGVLRVLFLTILGLLVSLGATVCCGYSKTIRFTLLTGLGLSLASALLMELCLLMAGDFPAWYLLLVPMVTVLALRGEENGEHHGGNRYDPAKDWDPIPEKNPTNSSGSDWSREDEDFFSAPAAPKKGRKSRKSKRNTAASDDPFDDFDF